MAPAQTIAARADDINATELGPMGTQRPDGGWKIRPPAETVRVDIAVSQ